MVYFLVRIFFLNILGRFSQCNFNSFHNFKSWCYIRTYFLTWDVEPHIT